MKHLKELDFFNEFHEKEGLHLKKNYRPQQKKLMKLTELSQPTQRFLKEINPLRTNKNSSEYYEPFPSISQERAFSHNISYLFPFNKSEMQRMNVETFQNIYSYIEKGLIANFNSAKNDICHFLNDEDSLRIRNIFVECILNEIKNMFERKRKPWSSKELLESISLQTSFVTNQLNEKAAIYVKEHFTHYINRWKELSNEKREHVLNDYKKCKLSFLDRDFEHILNQVIIENLNDLISILKNFEIYKLFYKNYSYQTNETLEDITKKYIQLLKYNEEKLNHENESEIRQHMRQKESLYHVLSKY